MWPAFLGFHTGGTRVAHTPHLASRVPVVMLGVPLPPMSPEYAALGMYAAKIVLYGLMVEDSVGKIGHSREIACTNDIKLAGCLLTEGAEEGTEKGTNDNKWAERLLNEGTEEGTEEGTACAMRLNAYWENPPYWEHVLRGLSNDFGSVRSSRILDCKSTARSL